ncbi:hypothetical protein DL769_011318 [Monosporascus sp. CRB-8-3]|nr:hypothetical protein DL769_011318 [Monosporascus sp. CRB-8-3]
MNQESADLLAMGYLSGGAAFNYPNNYPVVHEFAIHCPLCDKHDGDKGFTRRDHLLQHLKRYHRVNEKGLARFTIRNRH